MEKNVKEKKNLNIYYIALGVMPIFCVLAILVFNGYHFNLSFLQPVWNDECGWWKYAGDMAEYGRSLGYNGYNGTHAELGTAGPWGIAPLFPYALFGKIFGWNLNSIVLTNIILLSVGLLLFCLFVKPTKKQVLWLVLLYLCSTITINYSLTSMSEPYRYSLAIVLGGIVIWLDKNATSIKEITAKCVIKYLVIIVFLFYAINVYLILALLAFPILWIMLRGLKKILRISITVVLAMSMTYLANKMVSLVTAPYISSTLKNISNAFKESGIYGGFSYSLKNFFLNISTLSWNNLSNQQFVMLKWFFIGYILLIVLYGIKLIRKLVKKDHGVKYDLLILFLLSGFLMGYCLLYTGEAWTLCRGINTSFQMTLFVLGITDNDFDARIKGGVRTFIVIFTLIGFIKIWGDFKMIIDERYSATQDSSLILEEKNKLSSVIYISKDNPTWENTIALYGNVDRLYLALPLGAGINEMMRGEKNEYAKWAVISKNFSAEEIVDKREMMLETNHEMVFEDDYFIVFVNKNIE